MGFEPSDFERAREALAATLRKLRHMKDGARRPIEPPLPPICSFCGAGTNEVEDMLPGPKANICCDCIDVCRDIIQRRRELRSRSESD
jgi:hypothetical protein